MISNSPIKHDLDEKRKKKKGKKIKVRKTGLAENETDEGRSQCPRGLRHELSSLARTLGSWVRIPLEAWMSVYVYSAFVLGIGLATG
jgi:hypothetical protein